jgi:hypothetical protein
MQNPTFFSNSIWKLQFWSISSSGAYLFKYNKIDEILSKKTLSYSGIQCLKVPFQVPLKIKKMYHGPLLQQYLEINILFWPLLKYENPAIVYDLCHSLQIVTYRKMHQIFLTHRTSSH